MIVPFAIACMCILQARGDLPNDDAISPNKPTNWVFPNTPFRVKTKGETAVKLYWNDKLLRIYSRHVINGATVYIEDIKNNQDGIQLEPLEIEGEDVSLNVSVSGPGILEFGFLHEMKKFNIQTRDTVHTFLTLHDYSGSRMVSNNTIVLAREKSIMSMQLKGYSVMGASVSCKMCYDDNCSSLEDLQNPKLESMAAFYVDLEVIFRPRKFEFDCWTALSLHVKKNVIITAKAIVLPSVRNTAVGRDQTDIGATGNDLVFYFLAGIVVQNLLLLLVYATDCCTRNCKKEKKDLEYHV